MSEVLTHSPSVDHTLQSHERLRAQNSSVILPNALFDCYQRYHRDVFPISYLLTGSSIHYFAQLPTYLHTYPRYRRGRVTCCKIKTSTAPVVGDARLVRSGWPGIRYKQLKHLQTNRLRSKTDEVVQGHVSCERT